MVVLRARMIKLRSSATSFSQNLLLSSVLRRCRANLCRLVSYMNSPPLGRSTRWNEGSRVKQTNLRRRVLLISLLQGLNYATQKISPASSRACVLFILKCSHLRVAMWVSKAGHPVTESRILGPSCELGGYLLGTPESNNPTSLVARRRLSKLNFRQKC